MKYPIHLQALFSNLWDSQWPDSVTSVNDLEQHFSHDEIMAADNLVESLLPEFKKHGLCFPQEQPAFFEKMRNHKNFPTFQKILDSIDEFVWE